VAPRARDGLGLDLCELASFGRFQIRGGLFDDRE
jgi:hypothetical protein